VKGKAKFLTQIKKKLIGENSIICTREQNHAYELRLLADDMPSDLSQVLGDGHGSVKSETLRSYDLVTTLTVE
jgi:hypothetical protein